MAFTFRMQAAIALLLIHPPLSGAEASCEVSQVGIAAHIVEAAGESGQLTCETVHGFGCKYNSMVETEGSLGIEYYLYLVAVDVVSSQYAGGGLTEIEVGIAYDGGLGSGADLLSWNSCASTVLEENGWPSPGSGHVFQFTGCRGSVADSASTEGTAVVLLGWFRMIAHSPDEFRLTGLDYREDRFPRLTTCDSNVMILPPYHLGSVTFGKSHAGWDPCETIVDAYPATCCFPDSCDGNVHPICCELAGGTYLGTVPCDDCVTGKEETTWGRIKSRYPIERN